MNIFIVPKFTKMSPLSNWEQIRKYNFFHRIKCTKQFNNITTYKLIKGLTQSLKCFASIFRVYSFGAISIRDFLRYFCLSNFDRSFVFIGTIFIVAIHFELMFENMFHAATFHCDFHQNYLFWYFSIGVCFFEAVRSDLTLVVFWKVFLNYFCKSYFSARYYGFLQ